MFEGSPLKSLFKNNQNEKDQSYLNGQITTYEKYGKLTKIYDQDNDGHTASMEANSLYIDIKNNNTRNGILNTDNARKDIFFSRKRN